MADPARPQVFEPLQPVSKPAPDTGGPAELLWLCCHFPALPLEVLGIAQGGPAAAMEPTGAARIAMANAAAASDGVTAGQPVNAALALCPSLRIEAAHRQRERSALLRLAEGGLAFTPWVSLDYPNALLLEVRGSLMLFGGIDALMQSVRRSMAENGHGCLIAVTPSPFASWLLARHGIERVIERPQALRSALGGLPIDSLGLKKALAERLSRLGLHDLRGLWRLPRNGLRRRYGAELLEALDRAAGVAVQLPKAFHLPPQFEESMDLPLETVNRADYWPLLERLMQRLCGFLLSLDGAAAGIELILPHRKRPATRVPLELRQAGRDPAHLLALLQEKLERIPLPAAVSGLRLKTLSIQPYRPVSADLFGHRPDDDNDWTRLIETLQSRLGEQAVRTLSAVADHRPERSFLAAADQPVSAIVPNVSRPLWLLPKPRPAPADLRPLSGTERIESGWWDETPVRRDYRIAEDRRGTRWWIYRELNGPKRWYLHGLFG